MTNVPCDAPIDPADEPAPVTLRSAQLDNGQSEKPVSGVVSIEVIEIKKSTTDLIINSNNLNMADIPSNAPVDPTDEPAPVALRSAQLNNGPGGFKQKIASYVEAYKESWTDDGWEAWKMKLDNIMQEIVAGLDDKEKKNYLSAELINNHHLQKVYELFSAGKIGLDNFIMPFSACKYIAWDRYEIMEVVKHCRSSEDVRKCFKLVKHPIILFDYHYWPKLDEKEMKSIAYYAGRRADEIYCSQINGLQEKTSALEKKAQKSEEELKAEKEKNQQLKDALKEKNEITGQLEETVDTLNDTIKRYRGIVEGMGAEIDSLKYELAHAPRNRADSDLAKAGLDAGTMSKVDSVVGKEGTTKIVKGIQRLMASVVHPDLFSGEKKKDAEEILKMVNAAVTKILGRN